MRRLRNVAKLTMIAVAGSVMAGCSGASVPSISDSITVTARFDNASGMYVGNAVSVLGMKVGKVESITPRAGYVDITMSVDKSTAIPADVTAVTVNDSILTDRHVELTPVYRGGARLVDGSVLPQDRTRTPVEFDSVLSMVDKLTTSLGGDGKGQGPIADLIDVGSAASDGNGQSIRAALSQLSEALQLSSDKGVATGDAITSIVKNLDTLTVAAARNDQTIREFGSGVGQLSSLLAELNLGDGDTGTKLNQIIAQATAIMNDNRANLATTVSNGGIITNTLKDYNGNLAEFLTVFPLAVDNAYNAVDQEIGAVRVHANIDQLALDSQMTKEICNLLGLKQLGCATGKASDMGPDFGLVSMLAAMAGVTK